MNAVARSVEGCIGLDLKRRSGDRSVQRSGRHQVQNLGLTGMSGSNSGCISFGAIWDIISQSTESAICEYVRATFKI
jgi:hypothetical protein